MKTTVHVENHSPVPLEPLGDVIRGRRPFEPICVYIESLVMDDDSAYDGGDDYRGWWLYDNIAHEFHSVSEANWLPDPNEVCYERTLARRLQPGERLVITHEG